LVSHLAGNSCADEANTVKREMKNKASRCMQ
jgi:hypothetical protein